MGSNVQTQVYKLLLRKLKCNMQLQAVALLVYKSMYLNLQIVVAENYQKFF